MGDAEQVIVEVKDTLSAVPAAEWDSCANPGGRRPEPPAPAYDPFLSYAFLNALEESGSATARTGWAPRHLIIRSPDGRLAGAMPMYLKSHSRGEYVFDYGWADAFERAGGSYYPKLQVSVPFTPATGRRLLVPPGPLRDLVEDQLLYGAVELANRLGVSSVHFTFMEPRQWERLGEHGLLQRTDQQFHWQNQGYATFDDFLSCLASRKRKTLRKERAAALESGIEIEWVTGSDLREEHWDAFFAFYMDTGSRKWGSPYLTRPFFSMIGERMADDVLLVMAKRAGRYIAGALNFIGSETLYGRNWGCIEDHRFLHFECCYYQAIDFAIAHGLKRVEAGAQGAHKLARGYLPVRTHSAHFIANPSFRDAVEAYLAHEREAVDQEIDHLTDYAPFKKTGR